MKYWEAQETVCCPICEEPVSDDGSCDHLVISSEDAKVIRSCVDFCGGDGIWQDLRARGGTAFQDVGLFLQSFVEGCPSADRVDRQHWQGGAPGLSGISTLVWSGNAGALKEQIRARLAQALRRLDRRMSTDEEGQANCDAFKRLAESVVEHTNKFGSACFNISGESLAEHSRNYDLEKALYAERTPHATERRQRQELFRLARYAVDISGDRSPHWQASLRALAAFCSDGKGFLDLIEARRALQGPLAGVWVGINHACPNAPAALTCYHACNPDLAAATEQAKYFFRKTVEFVNRQRGQDLDENRDT
jgi:hypothetical protein